ncbi:MAG: MBL fold metallo-hydrolase [Planctomycetota bacterium]
MSVWTPASVEVGPWRITALSDGHVWLDGGAMWGVVPKTLWSKWTPPDDANRIRLALRPFLVEGNGTRILVEPGIGDRWEPKWREIYGIDRAWSLEQSLRALDVDPASIEHVLISHAHFDHVGAAVVERAGELTPLCGKARHWMHERELASAFEPFPARRASYRPEDVAALRDAGLCSTFTGVHEIVPGVRAHEVGGHSTGVSVFTFEGDGETALFWADVCPTTHHVQPAYIMAYDVDVERSFRERSEWFARAADGDWLGLFYHDDAHAFGRLRRDGRRFAVEPLQGE